MAPLRVATAATAMRLPARTVRMMWILQECTRPRCIARSGRARCRKWWEAVVRRSPCIVEGRIRAPYYPGLTALSVHRTRCLRHRLRTRAEADGSVRAGLQAAEHAERLRGGRRLELVAQCLAQPLV